MAVTSRAPSSDAGDAQRSGASVRWFAVALAVLIGFTLAAQLAILAQGSAGNPFARVPIVDAKEYWRLAGAIARGELVGDTPFLSAPLYPYMLGLVRAVGGGLEAVYGLQVALHLATAVLLAAIGRRRYGAAAGLAGAALYLLLQGPAFQTGRLLSGTLQAFCIVMLWDRLLAAHAAPDSRRSAIAGLALGIACLVQPPLLAGVPLFALWIGISGERAARAKRAFILCAVALLTVAPATLHNWLAAGELIPISAQAGITFYHGNNAGADGTYHAAEGVSTDRFQQNLDARAAARAELGPDAGWKATDRYFLGKGLAFWRADPVRAVKLTLRKAWWFASGRTYGDVYNPTLERESGLASRLAFAPVPVAWCTLVALVALLALLRHGFSRCVPELTFVLVPFLVVCVFWYSPRYRLPAVPVMAVLAGAALVRLGEWRASPARAAVVAAAVLASALSGTVNRWAGFDGPDAYRQQFTYSVGAAFLEEEDLPSASIWFARAEALGHPLASASLADVLRREGDEEGAIEAARAAVRARPDDPYVLRGLAVALATAERFDEAIPWFEKVLARDPNDRQAESGLGNCLLETDRADDAIAHYLRALEIDPEYWEARFYLALAYQDLGRNDDAERELAGTLLRRPAHIDARVRLARLYSADGREAEALQQLVEGLAQDADRPELRLPFAWLLATASREELRDGARARSIAEELCAASDYAHPHRLDILAAACAETDDFEAAVRHAERAEALLREAGLKEWAGEVGARLAEYRAREPHRSGR